MPAIADITEFYGPYRFLSNFYPSMITIAGKQFSTVEHYFQAMKMNDLETFERVRFCETPGQAKKLARSLPLREAWEEVKEQVMRTGLHAKFSIPGLRERLLRTGDVQLVEGNTWGDTYWGVCNGVGKNRLGVLLMELRSDIRSGLVS